MRLAATAGAGRRRASEQRIAVRDLGTHIHFFLLSSLHLCLISYVRLHICVRERRKGACGGDVAQT